MRQLVIVLAAILLTNLILADPQLTTQKILDYPPGKLQRITIYQPVTYPHRLIKQDAWAQYPGLTITFTVPFAQYVQIKYNVIFFSGRLCYFITRLMTDGNQDPQFRAMTSYTEHHTNSMSGQIYLEKGKHTISVQYRSGCGDVPFNHAANDWQIMLLKVVYYSQVKVNTTQNEKKNNC